MPDPIAIQTLMLALSVQRMLDASFEDAWESVERQGLTHSDALGAASARSLLKWEYEHPKIPIEACPVMV